MRASDQGRMASKESMKMEEINLSVGRMF